MAAKKKSARAPAFRAAQSREEAELLLADIGASQRELTRIRADMNEQISTIKAQFEEAAKPFKLAIDEKVDALHMWAEANRDKLLTKGSKTVELATGVIQWRMLPPSVRISGVGAVMEILKLKNLSRFLRVKEEINKDAILAEPAAVIDVTGISIQQTEEFIAKPFEAEIEHVSTKRAT